VHGFLSLKARLARLFSRGDDESSRRALSGRSEPSFGSDGSSDQVEEEEQAGAAEEEGQAIAPWGRRLCAPVS